ncbi:MAG: hypothetical protein ACPGRX_06350 [Bdellovibrionales bacterium]
MTTKAAKQIGDNDVIETMRYTAKDNVERALIPLKMQFAEQAAVTLKPATQDIIIRDLRETFTHAIQQPQDHLSEEIQIKTETKYRAVSSYYYELTPEKQIELAKQAFIIMLDNCNAGTRGATIHPAPDVAA